MIVESCEINSFIVHCQILGSSSEATLERPVKVEYGK
jgi:hypothetical protein